MLSEQWLAVINAERDREIKAAQRAHLVDRNRVDDEPAEPPPEPTAGPLGRIARRLAQPGAPTADPSL